MCSVDQEAAVQESTDANLLRTSRTNLNPNLTSRNLSSNISGSGSSSPKTPVCRFFANKQTCPYGDQCRYRHSVPRPSKPVKQVCRHYLQSQCRYGNRCKFYHPDLQDESKSDSPHFDDTPGMLDVNDFPSISLSKTSVQDQTSIRTRPQVTEPQSFSPKPLEQKRVLHHHDGSQSVPVELQLEAFFKRASTITPKPAVSRPSQKQPQSAGRAIDKVAQIEQLEQELLSGETDETPHEKSIHIFKFEPSDPNWGQFGVPVLQMMVTFTDSYPEMPLSLKIIDDGMLPKPVLLAINTRLNQQATLMHLESEVSTGHTPVFRSLLNWLDENITEISTWEEEAFVSDGSSSEYSERSDNAQEAESDGEEDEEDVESEYLRPTKKGTEIRIMDFTLNKNVATLQLTKLKLTVQCTRCKNKEDIACSPEKTSSQVCGKCQSCFSVKLHPDVAHPSNNTLGYMDILGCKPMDIVLPSCEFTLICLECQKDHTLNGWGFGQGLVNWCRGCHSRLEVASESCKFIVHQTGPQRGAMADEISATRRKPGKKLKDREIIQVGQPLPDLGTCEHYKKSHRWLRFPCCGKAYPCDVCHDQSEDHCMERANRMICGYCSKEQAYSGTKPCILCESDMAFVKTSVYWEGGKGCRNKTKMKRTDPHKYKQENKTVSKKSERVGEKGKANRPKNHPSV